MKRIEFFGISNSGKSFLKNALIKEIKLKCNIYSYKQILCKYLAKEENNIIKKFLLKVYLISKNYYKKNSIHLTSPNNFSKKKKEHIIFNKIKGLIYQIYETNLKKIFKKKKYQNFKKLVVHLIENSNFSNTNKNIFKRWFFEEMAALYIIKKNFINKDYVIDSEGFIQRLFIYSYKKKSKKEIINKYLDLCPLPDKLFFTSAKRYKIKVFKNSEFNMELNEQKSIYKQTLKTIKNKIFLHRINLKNYKKIINLI